MIRDHALLSFVKVIRYGKRCVLRSRRRYAPLDPPTRSLREYVLEHILFVYQTQKKYIYIVSLQVPRSHPPLSRKTLSTLSKLNVKVGESGNPLEKWDQDYYVANKIGVLMQASANGCSEHATHIVLLDTDIIAVSSSLNDSRLDMLFDRSIHVPVAGHADASRAARWSELYGLLNLPAPSIEITSLCSREKMPLYYSSGMIVMPRDSDLATMWMLTARSIAQDMSLGTSCCSSVVFEKCYHSCKKKNIKCVPKKITQSQRTSINSALRFLHPFEHNKNRYMDLETHG